MANFADNDTGRSQAEALVKTRTDAHTWIEGFRCLSIDGHTAVRFIRPMSHTNPGYGAWVESRDTAAT